MFFLNVERPGARTPWLGINQLLAPEERFEVSSVHWQGFLLAPKNLARLSALLFLISEQQLPFHVQGRGLSCSSLSTHIPLLISTRNFKQVKLLEGQVLEIGTGCDLRSLTSESFRLNIEVALEDWIWASGRGSVGSAVLRGCQSGLVLRETSIQERVLAVELVKPDGGVIKLGQEIVGAYSGPAVQHLIWGIEKLEGVLTKVYLLGYPIPKIRFHLSWSFASPQEAWQHLQQLQTLTSSWERLDCVISRHKQEKSFVLAQISGLEEEMEAFKVVCPAFKTAELQDKTYQLKTFFLHQGFYFTRIADPIGDYVWFHALTNQSWLITRHPIIEEKNDSASIWKERLHECLKT